MFSIEELRSVERIVATAAAEELLPRFRRVEAHDKSDGSLITEADVVMQQRICHELKGKWPHFAFLGEEMSADEQQQMMAGSGAGLWCLDPLDGTSNFAAGIPFFGVSLALLSDRRVVAGVVYDPVQRESFSALRGAGAWLNEMPLVAPRDTDELARAMAMVDLKRLPAELIEAIARQAPFRSQRSFGSVALDWCWVAAGRCQVYLHGGQKLWDYAAGSLVLHEAGGAGGVLDDYRGDWIEQPVLAPRIGLAATNPALLAQWRAWINAQLS